MYCYYDNEDDEILSADYYNYFLKDEELSEEIIDSTSDNEDLSLLEEINCNNFCRDEYKNTIKEGYYPPWLTDEEYGNEFKQKLVECYDDYFYEKDPDIKKQKLDNMIVYLTIVSDVIAYRYLVKHYSHFFRRLNITIDEYLDYKVERMYVTIRDKKDKIKDIISYIYMSFMLSSPRLIYDYASKVGRCKLYKESIPYYQTQRFKFFFVSKKENTEHIIYNVDNIDLDIKSENIRSNIEKYSFSQYCYIQQEKENSLDTISNIKDIVNNFKSDNDNSKNYLIYIFENWDKTIIEDFETVKKVLKYDNENDDGNFSLFDYICYKYENNETNLNYNDYIEVVSILNSIVSTLKERG